MTQKYISNLKWFLLAVLALLLVLHRHLQINLSPPFVGWFAVVLENLSFIVLAGIVVFGVFNLINAQVLKLQRREEEYEDLSNQLKIANQESQEKAGILSQKINESSALHGIIRTINQTMDVDKILSIILENICKRLSYDRAVIFLIQNHQGIMEAKHSVGMDLEKLKGLKISLDEKENFVVRTVLEKLPRIIKKVPPPPARTNSFSDIFGLLFSNNTSMPPNTIASVPIEAKDKVIGALVVDNVQSKQPIEEKDLRTLVTFTSQAGLAIDNARLYQTEKNFHEELQRQVDLAVGKLNQAQKQLVQSEKLAALGEMAAVVTHEVRNPLSTIRGSAEIIADRIKKTDPSREFVDYIIHEVDRLNCVVTDILTFSRQPQAVLSEQDINGLIRRVLVFLEASDFIKHKIQCIKQLDETLPVIPVDSDQMKQVLLNVIQNACHFMVNRSIRRLTVKTYRQNEIIKVEISDTGSGISPENTGKIFEPFFTTKTKGTGLGLSISKSIIESHGGKIEVKSELNIGTTFTISLPIKKEEDIK